MGATSASSCSDGIFASGGGGSAASATEHSRHRRKRSIAPPRPMLLMFGRLAPPSAVALLDQGAIGARRSHRPCFTPMKTLTATALVATLFLAACANGPRPAEELARAKSLVEQADAANAQRFAADELTQARNRLQEAERAAAERENHIARRHANEAAADAELASALARSRQVEQAANEEAQNIEAQRDEIRQRGASAR